MRPIKKGEKLIALVHNAGGSRTKIGRLYTVVSNDDWNNNGWVTILDDLGLEVDVWTSLFELAKSPLEILLEIL